MINKFTIIFSVLVIAVFGFFVYRKYFIYNDIHYHAGFRVFVDGVQQDFSGPEYMSLKPCGTATMNNGQEQEEKGHLHDRVGYVVHVHRPGAVWRDLFTNIHYQLDPIKPVKAYINGKPVKNFLDEPIKPYESLIVLQGKYGAVRPYLEQAVTQKQIKTAEQKSEDCGTKN